MINSNDKTKEHQCIKCLAFVDYQENCSRCSNFNPKLQALLENNIKIYDILKQKQKN